MNIKRIYLVIHFWKSQFDSDIKINVFSTRKLAEKIIKRKIKKALNDLVASNHCKKDNNKFWGINGLDVIYDNTSFLATDTYGNHEEYYILEKILRGEQDE